MALDFTLTYFPDAGGYFVMEGGPLERTWKEINWMSWVSDQPEKNHSFYDQWAEDAKKQPKVPIKRELP